MAVITSCPDDGSQLQAVALDANTPPWLCANCHRGWWNAELTASARARYNPLLRDFGTPDRTEDIIMAVLTEWDGQVTSHVGHPG